MPRTTVALIGLVIAMLVGACATPNASTSPSASASTAAPSTAPTASPSADPTATPAPTTGAGTPPALEAVPVVGDLRVPVDIAVRPGDDATTYVLQQSGQIRMVRDGALVDEPLLDISPLTIMSGEQGMLGMAFTPGTDDPRVFVYYTNRDQDQAVASFDLDPTNPDRVVAESREEWLVMEDQFGNHNGGALAFGADGHLYISTGDGGGGGDPLLAGQALDTLLGKILRIDVTPTADTDPPYSIPDDNPFVDTAGARGEIWLTGLRNPWRMRFDVPTGDLWIGDVGQGAWEEINLAPDGTSGLNYGWSVMEGFECFRDAGCDTAGLTRPVAAYSHDFGCSVTGGAVYRGSAIPDLVGWYVYADYCSGRVWAIDAAAAVGGAPGEPTLVMTSERSLSSIGEGPDGELYATDHGGALLRFEAAGG